MFKIKQIVLGSAFILLFFGIVFNVNSAGAETTAVQKSETKPVIPEPDKKLEVTYKSATADGDKKLYVFARSVTVGEVFAEIAKQAKIEIKVDEETAKQRMSYLVDNKELKVGIEEILNIIGLRDLAISYKEKETHDSSRAANDERRTTKYEISKVEIRKRNKEEMAKVEEDEKKKAIEEMQEREKRYRELFKDMGKKGKLAGMMKDYSEGKKGADIQTYLRQADIKPEEKPLLREAMLDPKYNNLKGAIEMGLIHAIGDKPEESDKEYIIKLMKDKETKGLLLYGMKFIWDERFIPPLIEMIKDTTLFPGIRSLAAEILGSRKVKEAVPALEEALFNCSDCTEILVALRRITGLSHYIENGMIKTTTEKPKLAPDEQKYLDEFKKKMEEVDRKRKEKKQLEEKSK